MKVQDDSASTRSYADTLGKPRSFAQTQNFSIDVPKYIKEINLKQSLREENRSYEASTDHSPIINKITLSQTQHNKLNSQCSTILQTQNKVYLFLTRSPRRNQTQLIVYEYQKSNGNNKSLQFNGIKGEVTCIQARFCKKRKQNENYMQSQQQNKKTTKKGSQKHTHLQMVVLVGTNNGYLKTIRFGDNLKNQSIQNRLNIESLQVEKARIICITPLDPQYYFNANLCLILSMGNKVHLINVDIMETLAIFYPTIMNCESGLSLSVNNEAKYFVQCCQGGYIIFWQFCQNVMKVIKKSTELKQQAEKNNIQIQNEASDGSKIVTQKMERQKNLTQYTKRKILTNFNPKQLVYSITPLKIFHSASIYGLKFCNLFGNLLLLITQKGILKLLAINHSGINTLMDNQYLTLIDYKIKDGQLIIDAKFYPQSQQLFIVRSQLFKGIQLKNRQQQPIKPFNINDLPAKNPNKKFPNPYQPVSIKDIRDNANVQKMNKKTSHPYSNSRTFNNSNNSTKICPFERIIFDSELQISRIDQLRPGNEISCLQGLEIVQNRDIFVLRAKEEYLIGTMELL